MFRTPALFVLLVLAATAGAQDARPVKLPTPEQLIGEWIYVARADKDSPDNRIPVGFILEFRADGTVITKTTTREMEGTYVIDGATIIYSGPDRKETWRVRSFEPDKTLIVESSGMLSFLERRCDSC
jgi:hypothetical protein